MAECARPPSKREVIGAIKAMKKGEGCWSG
jgi:hypothetical protein